jgi:hypothetical protein
MQIHTEFTFRQPGRQTTFNPVATDARTVIVWLRSLRA